MALHNAFGEVSSEETLRRLVNNINFSRDNADRMRVVIDVINAGLTTSSAVIGYIAGQAFGANSVVPLMYQTGSPNAVDARDPLRIQHRANMIAIQQGRWTYS